MTPFARPAGAPALIEYVNTPPLIGSLISAKTATLWELQSVYGIMDAYNLLELQTVDAVNQRNVNDFLSRR